MGCCDITPVSPLYVAQVMIIMYDLVENLSPNALLLYSIKVNSELKLFDRFLNIKNSARVYVCELIRFDVY
jgi:hypothetical protein